MLRFLTFLFLPAGFLATSVHSSEPAVPVIVELFTSEGCSSCPPADDLLARLEGPGSVPGAEVIALGEHVTYWNQLGWRDRFSSEAFTARQEEYARTFRIDGPYTPQMVVNGRAEFVGSDPFEARRQIGKAANEAQARIELARTPGGALRINATRLPAEARGADVLLAITEGNLQSDVERGENRGRQLRHAAVTRSLTAIGRIGEVTDGSFALEAPVHLDPSWVRGNVKLVVFVQDRSTRRILAAAVLPA